MNGIWGSPLYQLVPMTRSLNFRSKEKSGHMNFFVKFGGLMEQQPLVLEKKKKEKETEESILTTI